MLKMMSGATDPAGVGNGTPRPTPGLGVGAGDRFRYELAPSLT